MTRAVLINQLRAFLAVVDHRGFRRAAAELDTSEGLLSERVGALRRTLGDRPLFERIDASRLTPAGVALLPHARRIVWEWEEASSQLAHLSAPGGLPRLIVGATDSINAYLLPQVEGAFRKKWGMAIDTSMALSSGVRRLVQEGSVALGLVLESEDVPSGKNTEDLATGDLVLITAPTTKRRAPLSVDDLFNSEIYVADPKGGFNRLMERYFRSRGYGRSKSRIISVGQTAAISISVQKNTGALGLLPRYALATAFAENRFALVSLVESLPRIVLRAAWPKGKREPQALHLCELLKGCSMS
jgi:DNA-binding transcriptional LysR family regulator